MSEVLPEVFIIGGSLLAYLAGYFTTARWLYVKLDAEEDEQSSDGANMLWAALCALLWPAVLVYVTVRRTVFRETPRQARIRQAAELAALRKDAARLGLSMPDEADDPPALVVEATPASMSTGVVRMEDCPQCARALARVAKTRTPPPDLWPTTGALMHRYLEEYSKASCPTHGHAVHGVARRRRSARYAGSPEELEWR